MSSSDPLRATERWRLDLAYDGRAFRGFAFQPRHETVVGELRRTLALTLRLVEEPVLVGAARTDTGVHALHQVVHVDLPTPLPSGRAVDPRRLCSSLNKQLRGRIEVQAATRVEDEFHARYSALWRRYRYLVLEDGPGLESTNAFSWSVTGPLDLAAMDAAAADVVGTHDFRSFCRRASGSAPDDPITRRVLDASWRRVEDPLTVATATSVLRLDIRAQSFGHNMVRALTSTMVAVGQGRLDRTTITDRLERPRRDHLPSLAPPSGLALVDVGYDAASLDGPGAQ